MNMVTKKINDMESSGEFMDDLVEYAKSIENKAIGKQTDMFLPYADKNNFMMPHSFARSSLFPAIKDSERFDVSNSPVWAQKGITVTLTGNLFNQYDLVVWLSIVNAVRNRSLGTTREFSSYELLNLMGHSINTKNYKILDKSINRLITNTIIIFNDKYRFTGHLIDSARDDVKSQNIKYKLSLNQDIIHLFGRGDWTTIETNQLLQLKCKPLAAQLMQIYNSHKFVVGLSCDTIKKHSKKEKDVKKVFNRKVKKAGQCLVDLKIAKSSDIENEIVTIQINDKEY